MNLLIWIVIRLIYLFNSFPIKRNSGLNPFLLFCNSADRGYVLATTFNMSYILKIYKLDINLIYACAIEFLIKRNTGSLF
jgi:hypothetical protein